MANTVTYRGVTYPQADMTVGSQYDVQSLDNRKLEVGNFSFEIQSDDPTIVNFTRNEPLIYNHDGVTVGIYYVQNIKRTGTRSYRMDATTRLDILLGVDHFGGIYDAASAAEVITDICSPIPVQIDKAFAAAKLTGYLPIAPKRDNLAKVLFRLGAALKTKVDGSLHVTALKRSVRATIPATMIYGDDANVDYPDKVTRVVLTEHQYIQGADTVNLFEGSVAEQTTLKFTEPVYDLVATGFTIVESGANYAVISAGTGTLTGKKYIHQTREVSREIQTAPTEKVETVDDQTLVTILESSAILDRLEQYYLHQDRIQASVARQNEAAGDVVAVYHPYTGETVEGTIESLDAELSYTIKARESILIGFRPFDPNAGVYNRVELIDTEKDFVVPPNVYKIRAVLIQGGKGGGKGNTGGLEGALIHQSISESTRKGEIYWAAAGGEGGEPGDPGTPGKVRIVEMDVTPGQVIHGIPGVGGAGETSSAPATEGTHSVFGDLSSEEGAILPGGWVEALSGTLYATTGRRGIKGGNGSGRTNDSQHAISAGEPVTIDGQTWSPGESYADTIQRMEHGTYNKDHGSYQGALTGSSGGGAAYGANGAPGKIPPVKEYASDTQLMWGVAGQSGGKYPVMRKWVEPVDYIVAELYTPGGNGANALPFPAETTIGKGGPGGNGGGGVGARCTAQVTNSYASGITPGKALVWLNDGYAGYDPVPGKGSDGSDGGPGGIFVYWHVDEEEEGVSLP